MKAFIRTLSIWIAFFITVAVSWENGDSYCVIFPQNGRDIFGVAQRNIIIFGEDEVSLIPQVHFEGNARDFGILVPVPAQPELSTTSANLFTEASFMTQPIVRRSSNGCGCDDNNDVVGPIFSGVRREGALVDESDSGVTVIFEQLVGMFQAVVLQATNAEELTQWLSENDYRFNANDADLLSDYVAQNWFFVAMKLDTNQVPSVINQWWTATTSPAKITFAHSGESLIYPLKVSSISTNERTEVLVYTIGNDPMRFSDAKVEYANEIDDRESDAFATQYPNLSSLIAPGAFVTKLRRSFSKAEMRQDFEIVKTDDRSEFRDIRYVNSSSLGVVGYILLAGVLFLTRRRNSSQNTK